MNSRKLLSRLALVCALAVLAAMAIVLIRQVRMTPEERLRRKAEKHGQWVVSALTQAPEHRQQEGIRAELVSAAADKVVIRYTNESGRDWAFSYAFELEVELGGVWYTAPPMQGAYFIELARELPAGQSAEKTCDLSYWGKLPAGHYRVACDGLTVEFDLKAE